MGGGDNNLAVAVRLGFLEKAAERLGGLVSDAKQRSDVECSNE